MINKTTSLCGCYRIIATIVLLLFFGTLGSILPAKGASAIAKESTLSVNIDNSDLKIAEYVNRQIQHYDIDPTNASTNYADARNYLAELMGDIVNGKNIYFHCVYGSDRTGTMAYLIQGILGVSDEERDRDFELSTFFGEVDRHRYFSDDLKSGSNPKKYVYMKSYLPTSQSIVEWFSYGRTDEQKVEDAALIESFRRAMIEGYTGA